MPLGTGGEQSTNKAPVKAVERKECRGRSCGRDPCKLIGRFLEPQFCEPLFHSGFFPPFFNHLHSGFSLVAPQLSVDFFFFFLYFPFFPKYSFVGRLLIISFFFSAINEYDLTLEEDPTKNRLFDSLSMWHQLTGCADFGMVLQPHLPQSSQQKSHFDPLWAPEHPHFHSHLQPVSWYPLAPAFTTTSSLLIHHSSFFSFSGSTLDVISQ